MCLCNRIVCLFIYKTTRLCNRIVCLFIYKTTCLCNRIVCLFIYKPRVCVTGLFVYLLTTCVCVTGLFDEYLHDKKAVDMATMTSAAAHLKAVMDLKQKPKVPPLFTRKVFCTVFSPF